MIFSAHFIYSCPHSVSLMGLTLRSKTGIPMRSSAFFMVALKEGWEINSYAAALEKLRSLYTS
jgi:hypothetical protein